MMASAFGGAVPGNDEALKKFAGTLSKYDGWEKVEYIGENTFNIEYRASGTFDRYFAFPIINDAAPNFRSSRLFRAKPVNWKCRLRLWVDRAA